MYVHELLRKLGKYEHTKYKVRIENDVILIVEEQEVDEIQVNAN